MPVAVIDANKLAEIAAVRSRKAWIERARPKQLFPEDEPWWNIGLLLAGRGFGKTRPLAEDAWWNCHRLPNFIYHVVARTDDDVRVTCYEGESGIRACCPPEILYKGSWDKAYNASLQEITFNNGSKILGFAARSPGQMRGPQCHRLWGDEVAAWEENGPGKTKEALDNALLGCRLPRADGLPSRALLSTTPRPIAVLRELLKRDDIIVRTGSLYENIANLSDNFKKTILPMEGTRMGEQEIHGKLLNMEELGIIKRSWFPLFPAHRNGCRGAVVGCPGCNQLPRFDFILISYDTALEEAARDKKKNEPDDTACQIYGAFRPTPDAKHRILLIDAWDDKLGYPELKSRVKKDMATAFGEKPYKRTADLTVVERKGSGISLLQDMAQTNPNMFSFEPKQFSKLTRLHLASPYVKNGFIWLPESEVRRGQPKSWCNKMLEQVCSFTGEGSIDLDDHVDSFSQAVLTFQRLEMIKIDIDKSSESVYDNQPEGGNPYDQ